MRGVRHEGDTKGDVQNMKQLDAFGFVEKKIVRTGKWSVLFSSKTPEHSTDDGVFRALDEEVGGFTLDAAASPKNAKCSRYFTQPGEQEVNWGSAAALPFCTTP